MTSGEFDPQMFLFAFEMTNVTFEMTNVTFEVIIVIKRK